MAYGYEEKVIFCIHLGDDVDVELSLYKEGHIGGNGKIIGAYRKKVNMSAYATLSPEQLKAVGEAFIVCAENLRLGKYEHDLDVPMSAPNAEEG